MAGQPGHIWIGTSNIVVPGNKSTFPPAYQLKSRLHYYSSIFNSVEVNSCFYKTPLLSTYEKWATDVPQDFKFSLKFSKEITHAKNLPGDVACIDNFINAASGIHSKKGCLLIQFPGKITLDHFKQVEEIMQELETHDPKRNWKKALEFRSPSWYTGKPGRCSTSLELPWYYTIFQRLNYLKFVAMPVMYIFDFMAQKEITVIVIRTGS